MNIPSIIRQSAFRRPKMLFLLTTNKQRSTTGLSPLAQMTSTTWFSPAAKAVALSKARGALRAARFLTPVAQTHNPDPDMAIAQHRNTATAKSNPGLRLHRSSPPSFGPRNTSANNCPSYPPATSSLREQRICPPSLDPEQQLCSTYPYHAVADTKVAAPRRGGQGA